MPLAQAGTQSQSGMMDLIGTLVARCFFGMVVLPVGRSVVALEAGVAVLRAQPQPHGRQPD